MRGREEKRRRDTKRGLRRWSKGCSVQMLAGLGRASCERRSRLSSALKLLRTADRATLGLQALQSPHLQRSSSPSYHKRPSVHSTDARLSARSMNAPVLVPTDGETDPLQIAMKELAAKKIPLVVRRYLPDGSYEVSRLALRSRVLRRRCAAKGRRERERQGGTRALMLRPFARRRGLSLDCRHGSH